MLALSYGERGESGELWKEPGQTVERVKEVRHAEAERAAAHARRDVRVPRPRRLPAGGRQGRAASRSPTAIREFAPDVAAHAHRPRPRSTPTTPVAFFAVERARALAAGAGTASAFDDRAAAGAAPLRAASAGALQLHPDDASSTSRRSIEQKNAAMAEMKAQAYLAHVLRRRAPSSAATTRGARRATPRSEYAEAFQRVTPQVVSAL